MSLHRIGIDIATAAAAQLFLDLVFEEFRLYLPSKANLHIWQFFNICAARSDSQIYSPLPRPQTRNRHRGAFSA
jgi:hypothetical protein